VKQVSDDAFGMRLHNISLFVCNVWVLVRLISLEIPSQIAVDIFRGFAVLANLWSDFAQFSTHRTRRQGRSMTSSRVRQDSPVLGIRAPSKRTALIQSEERKSTSPWRDKGWMPSQTYHRVTVLSCAQLCFYLCRFVSI
jgi:hypothetical protein